MNLKKFSISIVVILLLGLIVYRIFSNVEEESKNNFDLSVIVYDDEDSENGSDFF